MKQKNNPAPETPPDKNEEFAVIGTRIGRCDICKATKKVLLVSYGFSLCSDCLDICALLLGIIEQFEFKASNSESNLTLNTQ